MTLAITHAKTNTIPDWTQADLDAQIAEGNFPAGTLLANIVIPSDWNAALNTSMATGKLLGRSTAGTGSVEELTVGSGLTLSAGTLSANATGTNTGDVTLAGTPNYLTIAGQVITRALVNLTSHITGILGIANGGHNAASGDAGLINLYNDGITLDTPKSGGYAFYYNDVSGSATKINYFDLGASLLDKQPLDATLTSIAAIAGVQGDIIYASGTDIYARLAKNTTATRYLSNTGTSNNPAWAQVDVSNGITGQVPLANGGTAANLTASNGGIFYSTSSAGAILSGTATANKMLLSGATAAPTWSTSTIPTSAGATANKVLLSDGTNYVLSTPTFPNASATSGKNIQSDGTNWIASSSTWPTTATAGDTIYASGTNAFSTLAKGTSGYIYQQGATNPSWVEIPDIGNRLFNGGFAFDQRNAGASTAISDDSYALDRWNILTQTASVNVSQQVNQEDGTRNNIRLTQNQAAAQRMGLEQILPGNVTSDMRNLSATFAARVRISNSQAVRIAIVEWTGGTNAVTSDIVNDWTSSTYTPGNFFTTTSTAVTAVSSVTPAANTWTDISVTGTPSGSVNNLIVFIWTEGTAATNVTLDVARARCAKTSFVPPFILNSLAFEEAACQTFYCKSYEIATNPATSTALGVRQSGSASALGGAFEYNVAFPVRMFLIPTITIYAQAGTSGNATQDNGTEIALTAGSISTKGYLAQGTNGAGRYGSKHHFVAVAEL